MRLFLFPPKPNHLIQQVLSKKSVPIRRSPPPPTNTSTANLLPTIVELGIVHRQEQRHGRLRRRQHRLVLMQRVILPAEVLVVAREERRGGLAVDDGRGEEIAGREEGLKAGFVLVCAVGVGSAGAGVNKERSRQRRHQKSSFI